MANGEGAAYAGVGLGVLLIIFDMTAAGIAIMLVGVLLYGILSMLSEEGETP